MEKKVKESAKGRKKHKTTVERKVEAGRNSKEVQEKQKGGKKVVEVVKS